MRFLLSLLAAVSFSCAAAPFAAQVGDVRIALDSPPGFADTAFTGSPRLQELAESLTSASNRILLFAVSDADLRRFMGGDPMEARRYMVAVTPRVLERERTTPASFALFVEDSLRGFGSPPPPGTDWRKFLDGREGQQTLLAELRREPDALSVLQGIRFPTPPRTGLFAEEKPAQYALSTTSLVLLRGKPVSLTVHALYDTPADLEWIRSATLRWVDDLRRLNSR
ncbi:MAG TPA: hypothetical protein VG873_13475 [Burkholderiales bacterium]|nr:hypothetical protein [Burkholderiales bacterium]